MNDEITRCESFSNATIVAIREALSKVSASSEYAIVVNGSYARREASSQSDLDYFLICDTARAQAKAKKELASLRAVLRKHVPKDPAKDGAFGQVENIDQMGKNIGGPDDDNGKITRRILFLLEGEWLYNQNRFTKYRDEILSKYIDGSISDHQFCRFLLNDLIRYYRTVCVDYEHKTREQSKAWGSRNIKLVFSRKLLYFSGILVAAETWQHTYETKLERIKELLALTPIRRIETVCGSRANSALDAYGRFLAKMAQPDVREMLEDVPEKRDDQPQEFRGFKNEGHHFSWMLVKLLKDSYDSSHPIHNALVV